jgi:hypothetical protein
MWPSAGYTVSTRPLVLPLVAPFTSTACKQHGKAWEHLGQARIELQQSLSNAKLALRGGGAQKNIPPLDSNCTCRAACIMQVTNAQKTKAVQATGAPSRKRKHPAGIFLARSQAQYTAGEGQVLPLLHRTASTRGPRQLASAVCPNSACKGEMTGGFRWQEQCQFTASNTNRAHLEIELEIHAVRRALRESAQQNRQRTRYSTVQA